MIGMRIRLLFAATLALALFGSCSAPEASALDLWPGLDPGPHPVGLQVHHIYDHSRSFGPVQGTPEGIPTLPLGSRPLQITVWYPAARIRWPRVARSGGIRWVEYPLSTPFARRERQL